MDLDTLILLVPITLYLLPSLVIDRFALRSQVKLPRWLVYIVPPIAWIASMFARNWMGTFVGMGNWLFEPPVLSIAPIAFFVLAAPARRWMLPATNWPEVSLLVAIAVAVVAAGMLMPPIGDWP